MVNVRPEDMSKSELHGLIQGATRRAWFARRLGKPDCAEAASITAQRLRQELDRRARERHELFTLGARATILPLGC